MKNWLVPVAAIVIILIGGFFAFSFYLVKQVEPQLQGLMGPGFTVGEIRVKPLYLSAERIGYEDPQSMHHFLEIEEIRVYPALLSFLKPPLRIREVSIHRPSFFLYRTQEGAFNSLWMAEQGEKTTGTTEEKKSEKGKPVSIKIDRFRIRKGSFDFEDMKMGMPSVQIKVRELDLDLDHFQYPFVSIRSPFALTGEIDGRTKHGKIDLKGWVNLQTMDMETVFMAQGVDVKSFEPYYRKRVSAEIDSGSLSMESRITVKDKRIDASGKLELTNLHIKGGEGTVFWIPAKTLIALLKEKGDRVEVPFRMKGNAGDPEFKLQEVFLTQIALSLLETLGVPIQITGEEIFERILKGEKGWVEELKLMKKRLKEKKRKQPITNNQ
jgi:hypothetical protein